MLSTMPTRPEQFAALIPVQANAPSPSPCPLPASGERRTGGEINVPASRQALIRQKHRTCASAWARRNSFSASWAKAELRNMPPIWPACWVTLATVSAATYLS